jgi:hypothetical protein
LRAPFRNALEVGFEKLHRLVHELLVLRHDPEAAALLHVDEREVEAIDVKNSTVDDHHLRVIADEVVRCPRDGDTALQQVQLELAENLGSAMILMSCQRPHAHAAGDSGLQSADDRGDSGIGLNDELHSCPSSFQQFAGQHSRLPRRPSTVGTALSL